MVGIYSITLLQDYAPSVKQCFITKLLKRVHWLYSIQTNKLFGLQLIPLMQFISNSWWIIHTSKAPKMASLVQVESYHIYTVPGQGEEVNS